MGVQLHESEGKERDEITKLTIRIKKSENNKSIIEFRGYLVNRSFQKKKIKEGKTIKMNNKPRVRIE